MATKKKSSRGGARAGAGRPRAAQPPMVRRTVTLPADLAERLADLADGNLSAGIRRLAERSNL